MDSPNHNLSSHHSLGVSHSPAHVHIPLPSPKSTETTKKVEAAKAMTEAQMSAVSSPKTLQPDKVTIHTTITEFTNTDLNSKDINGYTLLMHAARDGNKKIVDTLIHAKADLNMQNDIGGGLTALMLAIDNGHEEIAQALVAAQADLHIQDFRRRTALMHAIGGPASMIALLAKDRASLNLRNDEGNTALMFAVKEQNLEALEELLNAQANPNITDNKNTRPLMWALEHDQREIAFTLLRGKAEIDVRNKNGYPPLHLAAENGDLAIVQELIRFGADINARTNEEFTALACAVKKNYEGIVQALLAEHADVNLLDCDGGSALMMAVSLEHEAIARMLIEAGSQIDIHTPSGYSPLTLALLTNQVDVGKLLIEKGANLARALEVIYRLMLAHIWGLKGHSTIVAGDETNPVQLNLEGMPLLKFSIKRLSEYLQYFFQSIEFEDTNLSQLIPKDTLEKILNCLINSHPLSPHTPTQILEKIQAENPSPFVILGGSAHHAISMVIYKDQLVICNRGEGRDQNIDTSTYYFLPPSRIDNALIEQLITIQPVQKILSQE